MAVNNNSTIFGISKSNYINKQIRFLYSKQYKQCTNILSSYTRTIQTRNQDHNNNNALIYYHIHHNTSYKSTNSKITITNYNYKSKKHFQIMTTTYPLDSLASDRALGSTCPLLSGLIHQLPTLKIHTRTQPHIKNTNSNLKNPQTNTNLYQKI